MDPEVKARGLHRRFQRLRARFSPTAIYSITDTPDSPAQPTVSDGGAADQAAPTTQPAAPADPTTNTPSAAPAGPTSSNTPAAPSAASSAPQPPATSDAPTPSDSPAGDASSTAAPPNSSGTDSPTQPNSSAPATSATNTPAANTPAPANNRPTPTQVQQGQPPVNPVPVDNTFTPTIPSQASLTGAVAQLPASGSPSPSPTGTVAPTSGVNVPVVIGIVVAVIVGIAGIIFAVTYFIRRSRRDLDDDVFSADNFRRQSTALVDSAEPTRGVPDRGITPRPPSMIQSRIAQGPPVSYGQHAHTANNGYYGYNDQPSFGPGQFMPTHGQPMPPQAWSPMTPGSAQPFFEPMGESPMASPVIPQYDSAYDAQGNLVRQPSLGPASAVSRQHSMAAASQLTRQPSAGPAGAYLTRQSESAGMTLEAPNSHYMDLARSSVSPYQAEQYAEISHQLSAPPPVPLPSPLAAAAAEQVIMKDDEVVADTSEPRPLKVVNGSPDFSHGPVNGSPFADSYARDEDMPKPPSPTFSNKSRIDSSPPTLPDMHRVFSPVSIEFPSNANTARPLPSPLGTSIEMPAAPAEAHVSDSPPPTPRPQKDSMQAPRPDTAYTVYDDDDAYGGI